MKISQIEINTIKNINTIHGIVENSFTEEIQQEVRTRKLWRVIEKNDKEYLIIISEHKPNVDVLSQLGDVNTFSCKDYDKHLDSFNVGDKVFFNLLANPTKALKVQGRKNNIKKECTTFDSQVSFLLSKQLQYGFTTEFNDWTKLDKDYNKMIRKGEVIDFLTVEYEGILTITNKDLFKKLLTNGLGKKKAFGCGLMFAQKIN